MANTAAVTREKDFQAAQALKMWNADHNTAWTYGENWTSVGTQFETFINKYLFPKLNESTMIAIALGNSFDFLAKEVDFVGQYSEEYVIRDTIPVAMNLTKPEEMMLKRNYPEMITKLYGPGILKKTKFTLNNNDVRQNFLTLGDATRWAIGVYQKRISDINVEEERELKAMLVDYAETQMEGAKQVLTVASEEELYNTLAKAIMDVQTNSSDYNESKKASGGTVGRWTTVTPFNKLLILTTTSFKAYLLNTKLANTFASNGIDLSDRIIAFPDLGGAFKATEDITISEDTTVEAFKAMGDYQLAKGDIIPTGAVFTFDVSALTEFTSKVEEVKPSTNLWALLIDIDAIKYRRSTKGMLKQPFYNGEYDEVTYWLHYYSFKAISPFYNKILIKGSAV